MGKKKRKSPKQRGEGDQKIEEIIRKLDITVVILLAWAGLKRKEVAKVLGVSEKTIERMLPFQKLKRIWQEKG
ncbi:MAG: ECF-type sigma factor [Candidatus Aenigmatarchaeota archaeon]